MNLVATAEAIRTYFLAQWALSSYAALPIAQDNRTVTEDPNVSWMRLTIPVLDRAPVAFGNTRIWRTQSAIYFQIFVPKGDGDGNARRYADAIGTILEGKVVAGVSISAVTFRPDVGDEVNWAQYLARLDYTVDELK